MGLTDAEFWDLTPRQYWALVERAAQRRYHLDRQIATVAAIIAEAHRDRKKRNKEFTADDFCLSRNPSGAARAERVQSPEEQIATFRWLTDSLKD